MKIAFSTLGCPTFDFIDILTTAKDFGYDGIEIRGIGNEIYAPRTKPFLPKNIDKTIQRLRDKNLDIPILTSAAELHKDEGCVDEIIDYIDLAACLSSVATKYIRVLGDTNPEPRQDVDIKLVARRLKELGARAADKGLELLIETNGVFANTETMSNLLSEVGEVGINVLWDIHHPYRFFHESPQQVYNTLKSRIKHVHVKDSIVDGNGTVKYKLAGYGDVPLAECLKLLQSENYTGYVSLEWVKRWLDDLEEPGIVFMQYLNFMRGAIAQ